MSLKGSSAQVPVTPGGGILGSETGLWIESNLPTMRDPLDIGELPLTIILAMGSNTL
jgi:hypothetical protein